MRILALLFICLSINSIAQGEEYKNSTHLRLTGIILPVSQVKIIESQTIKIVSSHNFGKSELSQKVYLTDAAKNIIPVDSQYSTDGSGMVMETVLLNYAKQNSADGKPIVFNIVSN